MRRSARWDAAADALIANDLAVLFLMTNQPGLLGSVGAAALANAAVLAYRTIRRRRAPAAAPACAA